MKRTVSRSIYKFLRPQRLNPAGFAYRARLFYDKTRFKVQGAASYSWDRRSLHCFAALMLAKLNAYSRMLGYATMLQRSARRALHCGGPGFSAAAASPAKVRSGLTVCGQSSMNITRCSSGFRYCEVGVERRFTRHDSDVDSKSSTWRGALASSSLASHCRLMCTIMIGRIAGSSSV